MVAELGWAGSWEFVIFLDFRMVPDNLLLTVVFSVGDWSTVVSGPLPFIPSLMGVVRAISRAPTQFANLFRSRGSVPRDFPLVLVPFLERWSGQKLIEVSSPFLLWPFLPLFSVCRRNWGRDENIIVWEDRWAWGSCYKRNFRWNPIFSFIVCFIAFFLLDLHVPLHAPIFFGIAVHALVRLVTKISVQSGVYWPFAHKRFFAPLRRRHRSEVGA